MYDTTKNNKLTVGVISPFIVVNKSFLLCYSKVSNKYLLRQQAKGSVLSSYLFNGYATADCCVHTAVTQPCTVLHTTPFLLPVTILFVSHTHGLFLNLLFPKVCVGACGVRSCVFIPRHV